MGFFDLNVPYDGSTPSDKATRIKLATKAMELGYSGIAYNRTMKGVMSDRDRCSILLPSLSSLLKVAPSLASSVSFHRDLLGVPRTSPFRQYTRLTVSADSVAQTQALNSGNPILKSYDLVAVKPLNQTAFDHACEKSEVDIISIDFSERLPFRLKLPMVRAAIRRGVYFEITYSNLLADVQVRRQMISNAKLLVDWTRGKNLVISSAASSVNEIRGPYDVANLLSLLGISTERAKASISKSCRAVIANAIRKRKFHKETIRVEVMASSKKHGTEELWSLDRQKWDPISSGNGDLVFDDDSEKSLSVVSKPGKAIDFAYSGFSVKDLLADNETVPLIFNGGKSLQNTAMDVVDPSVEDDEDVVASRETTDLIASIYNFKDPLLLPEKTIYSNKSSVERDATRDEFIEEPMLDMETVDVEESMIQNELASADKVDIYQGGNILVDKTMADVEIQGTDGDDAGRETEDRELKCGIARISPLQHDVKKNEAVIAINLECGGDESVICDSRLVDELGEDGTQSKSSSMEEIKVCADSSPRNNDSSDYGMRVGLDSSAAVTEPLPGAAWDDDQKQTEDGPENHSPVLDISLPEEMVKPIRRFYQPLTFPLKRMLDPAIRQMRGRKHRRKV